MLNNKFFNQVSKVLNEGPFSFNVTPENVLECQYNEGKGNFKFPLPYSDKLATDEGQEDKANLSRLVALFKDHQNRDKGEFPAHILEAVTDAMPEAKKAYKVTKKGLYFNSRTWEVLAGEIDLSNEEVKQGKEIECELIPDLQLAYHPKIGEGVSLVYGGHLIAGKSKPEFDSKDRVQNFIDTILSIGTDKVRELAESLIKSRKEQAQDIAKKEANGANETARTIRGLLMADMQIFDSWGAENMLFGTEGPAVVTFDVSGFIFSGKVEVSESQEGGFDVKLLDKGQLVEWVKGVAPGDLVATIDGKIEHPGDHAQYVEWVHGLNDMVEQAIKVA